MSGVGVTQEGVGERQSYFAKLFYVWKHKFTIDIHFIIVQNTEMNLKVVQSHGTGGILFSVQFTDADLFSIMMIHAIYYLAP